MPKFNPNDYEMVEDRLKKFWKDNPNGRVWTEVVKTSDDGSMVIVQAMVYADKEDTNPVATGIAQEVKGQGGFANADAWMENCETSAIGRALANWKYQGNAKKRPSAEEMSKVQVEKKPAPKPTKAEEVAMNKVVDEMVAEPKSDVPTQLNTLLTAMITDEEVRKTIKKKAYDELVNNGIASPDVKMWTKSNIDTFMTRAEDMFNAMGIDNEIAQTTDKDLVEEVFGEVVTSVVPTCPECNSPDWIEDNREKKQSDPDKFGAIPSWSCSTYQSNKGCGWTAWGDTDCPKEWL